VGRNDRAPTSNLGPHKLGRDFLGDGRAKRIAVAQRGASKILAGRDEFHLLGDDTGARIVELRDIAARLRAQWTPPGTVELWNGKQFARLQTIVLRLAFPAHIYLDVAAADDPAAALCAQSLLDVDRDVIVSVRTCGVVQSDWRLAARKRDFTKRHTI